MKRKAAFVCICIAAVLLVVVLFSTDILDKQRVWENMKAEMTYPDGRDYRSLNDGDSYGVITAGPGYTLPAGEYVLKLFIEADGENIVRLKSGNDAVILPEEIVSQPNQNIENGVTPQTCTFVLEDPCSTFEIEVEFCGGNYIRVWDVRLYSPGYKDNAFTAAFLCMALIGFWLLFRSGWLCGERGGRILLMALCVLIASSPALKDNLMEISDTIFHTTRIMNLADALESGQFPARLGTFSYNGYGAITSVFYPDLLLYPGALMILAGASIQYVVHIYYVLMSIAAAASMYLCARRIYKDRWAATCSACLYTCAIYRITDMYVRYALGESLALCVLPLFFLGLWEVIFGDSRRWAVLSVGAFLIFMSHMLSTLICAGLAAVLSVVFIVKILREQRMAAVVKAVAFTVGLCAFQLVPMVTYSIQGIGAQSIKMSTSYHAVAPAQLLRMGAGDMPVDPADITLSGMTLEIGFPLLLGAVMMLYVALTSTDKDDREKQSVLFIACGMAAAWMCTTMFPWGHVSVLTRGLSDYLQFPWRFLMLVTLFFALAGGYGAVRFFGMGRERLAVAAMLVIAVYAILPTLNRQITVYDSIEYGEGATPVLIHSEYTLEGTDFNRTRDKEILSESGITITSYQKNHADIRVQVAADDEGIISFPIFGFDGYAAELNGERIDWTLGDNNRLTVYLPAGAKGELHVWFEGRLSWKIAEITSMLTFTVFAVIAIRRKKWFGV